MSPTVCIQCNLKAFVEGRTPEVHNESVEDHMRNHHPDLVKAREERAELERKAQAIFERETNDAG